MRQLVGDERWRITRSGGASTQKSVPDMTWFHLRDHGRLRTQIGVQPISRCLRWNESMVEIDGVEQPLPYVSPTVTDEQAEALATEGRPGGHQADRLGLDPRGCQGMAGLPSVPGLRLGCLRRTTAPGTDPGATRARLRRGGGRPSRGHLAHATSSTRSWPPRCRRFSRLSEDDFRALRDNWGMPDGEDMLTETVDYELAGEPYPLLDRFPPLRLSLEPGQRRHHGAAVQATGSADLDPAGSSRAPFRSTSTSGRSSSPRRTTGGSWLRWHEPSRRRSSPT